MRASQVRTCVSKSLAMWCVASVESLYTWSEAERGGHEVRYGGVACRAISMASRASL